MITFILHILQIVIFWNKKNTHILRPSTYMYDFLSVLLETSGTMLSLQN
jgi:hypothetical protein